MLTVAHSHAGQIRNAPKKKTKMVIKFYPNHIFTVDDGPPRSTADAVNQRFLQAIKEQRIPDELAAQHPDGLDLSIMPMPDDYDAASAPKCAPHAHLRQAPTSCLFSAPAQNGMAPVPASTGVPAVQQRLAAAQQEHKAPAVAALRVMLLQSQQMSAVV